MVAPATRPWRARVRASPRRRAAIARVVHDEVAFTTVLTKIPQAALGAAHSHSSRDFAGSQAADAAALPTALEALDCVTVFAGGGVGGVELLYAAVASGAATGAPTCARFHPRLNVDGIQLRPVWHPLHRQPPFRGARPVRIEVTDRLWDRAMLLALLVGITARSDMRGSRRSPRAWLARTVELRARLRRYYTATTATLWPSQLGHAGLAARKERPTRGVAPGAPGVAGPEPGCLGRPVSSTSAVALAVFNILAPLRRPGPSRRRRPEPSPICRAKAHEFVALRSRPTPGPAFRDGALRPRALLLGDRGTSPR